MPTRTLPISWGALCIGMLLMSAAAPSARADGWWRFASNSDTSTNTNSAAANSDTTASSGTTAGANSAAGWEECPPGWRGSGRRLWSRFRYGYSERYPRSYVPVDPGYCDPRDQLLYSAQGYNVPVTVPLAPVCRAYNYGWGVPSARLTRSGAYSQWYPNVAFTQTQGRLQGGVYPMVYQPTDTTQAGVYYQYVPTWVPR